MPKHFVIGISIGLLIFLIINLLSAHFSSDCGLLAVFGRDAPWHRLPGQVCADDIAPAGWPLEFYEEALLLTTATSTDRLYSWIWGLAFAFLSGWLFLRSKTLSK